MERTWMACVLLAACSAKSMDLENAEAQDTWQGNDGADGDSGGSADELEGPMWWRLDADLVVSSGDIVAADSTLSVTPLNADGVELCVATGAPGAVIPVFPVPDDLLVTWWEVTDISWSPDCDVVDAESATLESLSLGVGAMHPDILAVLGTLPGVSDGAEGTLNGAYARVEIDGPIYVFGVAGPSAAFAGDAGPVASAPLTDGDWQVRGAYTFLVDGASSR
jgi:hypothetical protein